MTMREGSEPQHGNAYNIFILVLTVFSLVIMGLLILPLDVDTLEPARVYDNIICVVFLIDFALNLMQAPLEARVLLRRARLAGSARLDPEPRRPSIHGPVPTRPTEPAGTHHAPARRPEEKGADRGRRPNRGQYALFITVLSAMIVMTVSSVLVLQFESRGRTATSRPAGTRCGGRW